MDSSRGVRWAPPAVSSDYHTQSRQRGRERTRAETPQARPILRKSSRLGGNGGRVHTESSREPRKQFQRLEHRGDAILEWSVKQKQLHEEGGVIRNEQEAWRKHGKICRAQMIAKDEETENSLFVLNEKYQVDWYFKVANKVLSQYLQSGNEAGTDLRETYVIGHRLVKFLCQVLPNHENYFSEESHIWELRTNSQEQLVQLLQFLEVLAEQIDEEEYNNFIISDLTGKENDHPDLFSLDRYATPNNQNAMKSNRFVSDPEPDRGSRRGNRQTQQLQDPVSPMASPERRPQNNTMTSPQLTQSQSLDISHDTSLLFTSSLDYSTASSELFSVPVSPPPQKSLLDSTLRLYGDCNSDDDSTDLIDLSRNLYLSALDNESASSRADAERESDHGRLEASSSWDNSFLEHMGQSTNAKPNKTEQRTIQRSQSSQSIKSQASTLVQALVKNSSKLSSERVSTTRPSATRTNSNYLSSGLSNSSTDLHKSLKGASSPNESQKGISSGIESEIFGHDTVDFSEFHEWKEQQKKFEKSHHVAKKKEIKQKQSYQRKHHHNHQEQHHRNATNKLNTFHNNNRTPQDHQLQFEEPSPLHVSDLTDVYSNPVNYASSHKTGKQNPRIWKDETEEQEVSPRGVWDLKEWQSVDDTCSTDPSSSQESTQHSPSQREQQWASWVSSPYDNQAGLPGSNHPLFEDDKKTPGFHQLSSEDWEDAFADQLIRKPRGGQLRHFKSCIKCLVE